MDTPSLGALLSDQVSVGVHVDLIIENPTRFDVDIEDSEVVFLHRGERVAVTGLAHLAAPAGQTVTQTLRFTLDATPAMLVRGRDLLDGDGWRIVLHMKVAPYLDFPVYLL